MVYSMHFGNSMPPSTNMAFMKAGDAEMENQMQADFRQQSSYDSSHRFEDAMTTTASTNNENTIMMEDDAPAHVETHQPSMHPPHEYAYACHFHGPSANQNALPSTRFQQIQHQSAAYPCSSSRAPPVSRPLLPIQNYRDVPVPQTKHLQDFPTEKQDPVTSKRDAVAFSLLKSPTTLTFERMIEASELIAKNPALMKKVKHQSKALPQNLSGSSSKKSNKRALVVDNGNLRDDSAQEIVADEELQRRIVLLMALQRQPSEKPLLNRPPASTTICEGFFWREYPALEEVLFDVMADYYDLSGQRQSKLQQEFNNTLVERMRSTADKMDWAFEDSFSDKRLRDRIRCFFKTHQQNAKKRLATMVKNCMNGDNAEALRIMIRCVKTGCSLDEMQNFQPIPKKIRSKKERRSLP